MSNAKEVIADNDDLHQHLSDKRNHGGNGNANGNDNGNGVGRRSSATFVNLLAERPFLVGLSIRIGLMVLLPILMDDGVLLQGVKYTDIDYDVFTDAAQHVANGRSPFMRHTYRYTPFIAVVLSYASWPSSSSSSSTPTSIIGSPSSTHGGQNLLYHYLTWWRRPRYFGKLLFCIADALCGLIIMKLKQNSREARQEEEQLGCNPDNDKDRSGTTRDKIYDALWWLYNPLPINICTRGSGESFVVLLPVLFTVIIVMSTSSSLHLSRKRMQILCKAAFGGVVHGLAVHAKLYPIIYTVSFMAYLSLEEQSLLRKRIEGEGDIGRAQVGWCQTMEPLEDNLISTSVNATASTKLNETKVGQEFKMSVTERNVNLYPFPWLNINRLYQLVKLWIYRLLFTMSSVLFLSFFLSTFAILTYLAVKFYGEEALQEGLLYHFSRVDHRHNYSMFWYWIYLARGRSAFNNVDLSSSSLSTVGKGLLLPQMIVLLYSSLGIAPYDLPFALFIQTFSFVAQNKVMTAQYFTWYLVLLPLCSDRIKWRSRSMVIALALLGLSIVTWLCCAFCLEMKGMAFHIQVWFASVGFFTANINLLRVILNSYGGYMNDVNHNGSQKPKKDVDQHKKVI